MEGEQKEMNAIFVKNGTKDEGREKEEESIQDNCIEL